MAFDYMLGEPLLTKREQGALRPRLIRRKGLRLIQRIHNHD